MAAPARGSVDRSALCREPDRRQWSASAMAECLSRPVASDRLGTAAPCPCRGRSRRPSAPRIASGPYLSLCPARKDRGTHRRLPTQCRSQRHVRHASSTHRRSSRPLHGPACTAGASAVRSPSSPRNGCRQPRADRGSSGPAATTTMDRTMDRTSTPDARSARRTSTATGRSSEPSCRTGDTTDHRGTRSTSAASRTRS
jgi:hypothetical protein